MGSKLIKISQLSLHIKLHINIFYENEVYIIWFWSLSPSDDVGIKAITRSVLGKNGEKNEEVTDERLKGIEPKMIELIMNEVILVFEKNLMNLVIFFYYQSPSFRLLTNFDWFFSTGWLTLHFSMIIFIVMS